MIFSLLVDAFYELLIRLQEKQQNNQRLYGASYCTDYLDYIYGDSVGERNKPRYITQNFPIFLKSKTFGESDIKI
ncbi:hypothetical protein BK133_07935 [Paenibacillus sp. FSL H8-0548]|nr:hypothetical protein BK133_07935 [Paenibacillus sp. FSL H8-0548]